MQFDWPICFGQAIIAFTNDQSVQRECTLTVDFLCTYYIWLMFVLSIVSIKGKAFCIRAVKAVPNLLNIILYEFFVHF